jgi:hypothetical protein
LVSSIMRRRLLQEAAATAAELILANLEGRI